MAAAQADPPLVVGSTEHFVELQAVLEVRREARHQVDELPGHPVQRQSAGIASPLTRASTGRVADRAVEILGGRGYFRDNVAERMYRRLRAERIWEGASELQRLIVARKLLDRGPKAVLDA